MEMGGEISAIGGGPAIRFQRVQSKQLRYNVQCKTVKIVKRNCCFLNFLMVYSNYNYKYKSLY